MKRLVAVLLAAVLMMTCVPYNAFAAGLDDEITETLESAFGIDLETVIREALASAEGKKLSDMVSLDMLRNASALKKVLDGLTRDKLLELLDPILSPAPDAQPEDVKDAIIANAKSYIDQTLVDPKVQSALGITQNFIDRVADEFSGTLLKVISDLLDKLPKPVLDAIDAIVFDPNGGTGDMEPVKPVDGSVQVPECGFTPPRGMICKNWVTPDGEPLEPGTVLTDITGLTSLKAVWEYVAAIVGTNVGLYNSIGMNFFLPAASLIPEEIYYAVIQKDGNTYRIDQQAWEYQDSTLELLRFGFRDLAAKEMCDRVTAQLFFADGTPASELYTDTLRSYAMRMLDRQDSPPVLKTALVDMLNYGAQAQQEFNYQPEDLANALLTQAQLQMASPAPEVSNNSVPGGDYVGTTVSLKHNLVLSFYFKNITRDMQAKISYTNHYGEPKQHIIPGSEFAQVDDCLVVDVTGLAIADATSMVTCQIYSGDTLVDEVSDSIESYVARMGSVGSIFSGIMRFASSVKAYFNSLGF